jgi:pantoate--beta-alanine ligase
LNTFSHILDVRTILNDYREKKKSIALVPTMGYLHDGHLSLIKKAKIKNDIVVVSIFVNPTQFGPNEDFARYPRNIEQDTELAKLAGCDILFTPAVEEMYPAGFSSYAIVENISSVLEGKYRPTHFKGVTTIVLKLLNIVQPQIAYFGQKDAQQCIVIKKMVSDFNLSTEISIVPTLRESDGLAMSSRNVYLNSEERKNAVVLYQSLRLGENLIQQGERDSEIILTEMMKLIQSKNPTAIDYIEIVGSDDLEKKDSIKTGESILIPLAVRFGSTRLIDNIIINV